MIDERKFRKATLARDSPVPLCVRIVASQRDPFPRSEVLFSDAFVLIPRFACAEIHESLRCRRRRRRHRR